MSGKSFLRAALVTGLVCAPLTATADKPATTTTRADQQLGDTELQILAHVHQANQQEVQMGQLAMKQGNSAEVRSYGKMLVDDHGKLDQMLLAYVKKQGKTLPSVQPMNEADQLDMKEAKQGMDALHGLHGADFDREFLRTMIADHDKTIAKLNVDIGKTKNPEIVQMLRGALPDLEKHLDTAKTLASKSAQPAT